MPVLKRSSDNAHGGWVVDGRPVVPLARAMTAEAEVERLREALANIEVRAIDATTHAGLGVRPHHVVEHGRSITIYVHLEALNG